MAQTEPQRGTVLGLVGPVCAGKSQVARMLQQHGAEVFDADEVVRWLYEQQEVKREVRQRFGDDVFGPSGEVMRQAVADRIFGPRADVELRRRLTEEVIFPRTGRALSERIGKFRQRSGSAAVLLVDAPTMFEAGRVDWSDRILMVTAPLDRRKKWAAARGWPEGELERRDAALLPEAEKRRRADFVLDNNGTLEDLQAAVDRLWPLLCQSDQCCNVQR